MQPKLMKFDSDARQSLMEGALILAEAVGKTLGPRGKTVMIERHPDAPRVTKDGVSVAKDVFLRDPWANMGCQIIKQAALQTSHDAGDGTTTSTILAAAIVTEGTKFLAAGGNSAQLVRGLEIGMQAVLDTYERVSKDVEGKSQVVEVGRCAANQNMEIGEVIADAMDKVGKDGVVTVEEGGSLGIECEMSDGLQIDNGYIHRNFMTHLNGKCEMVKPWVLITNEKITHPNQFLALANAAVLQSRSLMIICADCVGPALATLLMNKSQGKLMSCVIKAPFWGDTQAEVLTDLATMMGCKPVLEGTGKDLVYFADKQNVNSRINELVEGYLGDAEKIVVTLNKTVIVNPKGDPKEIESRAEQLREQVDSDETSTYDREKIEQRLARMTGGIAKIMVGAATEVEMNELKDRVEDALFACQAAVDQGILPGGAVTPYYAARELDDLMKTDFHADEISGMRILKAALAAPLRVLATNAGKEPGYVMAILDMETKDEPDVNFGWDAAADQYGDMLQAGVIVPTKVESEALRNAVSAAKQVLTTEVAIVEEPQDETNQVPIA